MHLNASLNNEEAYYLSVSGDSATLSVGHYKGVLRGLETFSQLIQRHHSGSIVVPDAVEIYDEPSFSHRGPS